MRRLIQHASFRFAQPVFTVLLIGVFSPFATANVQSIVLQGDSATTQGEDATFLSFTAPSLNNHGQVAFAAQLSGTDVATGSDTGYWIATNGSLHSVIREGMPAPGMPEGTVFGNVSSLFTGQVPLNDAGEIVVGISVTQSSGLWVGNHQSLTLLAAQNSAAPGAENNANFAGLAGTRASLNRRGDVAFNASLTTAPYTTINSSNSHDGLWILNRSGTVATALAGMNATELGESAQVVGFRTFTYPSLNQNGDAAIATTHKLNPASTTLSSSVWVVSASGSETIAASGQPLPALGESAALSYLSQPGFNSAGTVVVNGGFNAPEGNPTFGTTIIVSDSEGLSLQAYSGGPAPGVAGHVFRDTFYEASIGSGGHIAFFGSAWDGISSVSGVWAGRPDELQPVVLQGESAPNANATFGGFARNTPAVNRFGQLAFPATLSDSQSGASSTSLWATDLDENLMLIARVGSTFEVAVGDVRTVSSLTMLTNHGDDDGRPRGLNDLGQIVFRAGFTDGTSGIFLSSAVAHLPGDYNRDGTVDAADYVVWRKTDGTQAGV